ncbi:MAG: hypothetical protein GXP62_10895 [Oligoflexia bacterium]|nr:hypothetical protein [Oligoflexia bacterium]
MHRASTLIATSFVRAWGAVTPNSADSAAAHLAGLDARHIGHVELQHLGRYLRVIVLLGVCLLVSAWSRVDVRQTSVLLDKATAAYDVASAEHVRLQVELAMLRDPANLVGAAGAPALSGTVPVITIPAP